MIPKKSRARENVVRDWTSLVHELLVEIAKLTLRSSVEDLLAFRGVCASWRAAGKDDETVKVVKPRPPVPFLLHFEKRQLYSLGRRKICMRLNDAGLNGERRKLIESRFGWVLTITSSGKAELLNPFSGDKIKLPGFISSTYASYDPTFDVVRRSVLSADPSVTPDFLLVVLLGRNYSALWFWKPGRNNWTSVKTNDDDSESYDPTVDVNYSVRDQRFYALDMAGGIWDLFRDGTEARWRLRQNGPRSYGDQNRYLLESSTGELLVVIRSCGVFWATIFAVYRLDVVDGVVVNCKGVESLKEAIFVGRNAAFCVPVEEEDASVKPNSIYFTDDSVPCHGRRGRDMGVYNLKDGSIQRFGDDAEALTETCPPLWVAPSSFAWLRSRNVSYQS